MKVALLHDRKPDRPHSATAPEDEFEEYDAPETVHAIARALSATLNLTVEPLVNDPLSPVLAAVPIQVRETKKRFGRLVELPTALFRNF